MSVLYLYLNLLLVHCTHRVPLISAVGDAAESAQSHLLLLTVQQPVLLMTGTGPRAQLLDVDQQVSRRCARLLEMSLDMSLATGLFAAQAHFPHGQRGAPSAEHTVQHGGDFLSVQSVKVLHDAGELEVLLQCGFLVVVMVALRAADRRAVFGPGLGDAAPAEVVLARQLDWLIENIQTDGAEELLFKAVLPARIHDFS